MRAVIDTNVLISGLLRQGPPRALMAHVRQGDIDLVSSPALLAELSHVLGRAKFGAILTRSTVSHERVLAEVRQLGEVIEPPPLPQPMCRDPDDDKVLALAVAAKADSIIPGDTDLLSLGRYAGTTIISPAMALALIAGG